MKLWLDALEHLSVPSDAGRPLRHRPDKRAVGLTRAFADRPRPLGRLYLLDPSSADDLQLARVDGVDKFTALMSHTYRLSFLEGLGAKPMHFRRVVDVARETAVIAVRRPRLLHQLDNLIDRLIADAGI
jgi:hypothetical protein